MKKIILLVLMTVLILFLGIGAKMYMDSKKLHEEMISVVKSEEAKKVFEDELRYFDPKSLTPEGIIQTYEINYESIRKNPMGGLSIELIINDDTNLNLRCILNKKNGLLSIGSMSISPDLSKKLGRWETV